MFLLHRLLLFLELALEPAHDAFHGTHLAHEAGVLASIAPPLKFFFHPLLLLGHQSLPLPRELLAGLLRKGLGLRAHLETLLRQRLLGVLLFGDLGQSFLLRSSRNVDVAKAAQQREADFSLLQGADIVATIAAHERRHLLGRPDRLDNLLLLPGRKPRENADIVHGGFHLLRLRPHQGQLQALPGHDQVVGLLKALHFRWLEVDWRQLGPSGGDRWPPLKVV
mmetsp:Transcript_33399/g.92252  ORF Transcript_33399/g.92252 Transcript_33399/m.92252 type:complete len:223 (+) Transcript_33399:1236-1904(+)